MMRMTERLLGRPSMTLLISLSTHGIRSQRMVKTSAKVLLQFILHVIELLEKNRHKRPNLEEVLNHPWFSDFKDIHSMRTANSNENDPDKFMKYTLTEPNSPKIKEEIEKYSKE